MYVLQMEFQSFFVTAGKSGLGFFPQSPAEFVSFVVSLIYIAAKRKKYGY